jgi:hypothetical protein
MSAVLRGEEMNLKRPITQATLFLLHDDDFEATAVETFAALIEQLEAA